MVVSSFLSKLRGAGAAVLFAASVFAFPATGLASVESDGVHIHIYHTNDMHARIKDTDDGGKSIGMGVLTAVLRDAKDKDADTLALDAGDTFHGTAEVNVTRGMAMARFLNIAGYDAMVPGNHDFNYGADRLTELASALNFPVLSANIMVKSTGEHVFPAYKEFTLDGVKVAVFGLTTPEAAYKTAPANVKDVAFENPVEAAKRAVALLRSRNDVVIGLMHMGLDDSSEFTSKRIAEEVPGIDLIIDGHSHTRLPEGLHVGDTLICQTGWHDYSIGEIELVVKDHKLASKKASLLDKDKLASVKPDEAATLALSELEKENAATFQKVKAKSPKAFPAEREKLRSEETELGNLVADALRSATDADVALQNGGGIREGLPKGNITEKDLLSMFPFGNTVVKLSLTGAELKTVLEHSVGYTPESFGGFQQVSGVTFTLDRSRPAGSRVSDIKIGGVPIDMAKSYTVATNDFTKSGGDGFDMLKTAKVVGEYASPEEILATYLKEHGIGDVSVGRIHVVEAKQKAA